MREDNSAQLPSGFVFKGKTLSFSLLLTVALVELIRTAWISDDAGITLRTVLNFIYGYGPVFNIHERVQAFTHPLWFLLLSGGTAVVKNIFFVAFALPILLSLWVYWLLVYRIAVDFWTGMFGACLLILSKAYVDFSTSGLENPLSHAILLLIILVSRQVMSQTNFKKNSIFFLLCAGLYLCRADLTLLIFPLMLVVIWKNRGSPLSLIKAMSIGFIPVLIWTVFSITYYGFLVPNTAYAKLGAGIPVIELFWQGGRYFRDSLTRDPLTLLAILYGFILGLCYRASEKKAVSFGILLYLSYVLMIGGDFMSGRYFTCTLLMAMVLIVDQKDWDWLKGIIFAQLLFLGMVNIHYTVLSGSNYENKLGVDGIADERGYWFQSFGLFSIDKAIHKVPSWRVRAPQRFGIACGALGFDGLFGGPDLHLIDICALADPLLAHLPAKPQLHWRIGHFYREVPPHYVESLQENKNLLADPKMHNLYQSLRLITRGKLFERERWKEIVKLNLGRGEYVDTRISQR
ncbi:MAG: hypothetical protein Q8R79_08940 [Legionellaceae bacterium]|nr:hypothetical protein [Legionellaceae bacterium]